MNHDARDAIGAAQRDAYHGGQIALLRRALRA
jgi:hypothetical protein